MSQAFRPVGSGATIGVAANGTTITYSTPFLHQGEYLRLCSEGRNAIVAAGSTAVAGTSGNVTDSFFVPKNSEKVLNIGKPASQRVVGLTTTATTVTIDFPEGTGNPFFVGQNVSLRVSGDDNPNQHWEFTHKPIASINNTAGVDGYFGTRLVVTWGYQDFVGTAFTAFQGSNTRAVGADLRASIQISAKGIKAHDHGSLHYQQGQISG